MNNNIRQSNPLFCSSSIQCFSKTPLALAFVGLLASGAAQASDADLLKRMQALEAELSSLKNELKEKEVVQQKKGVEIKKGTRFSYGGFVKADATWSSGSDGEASSANIFVPGKIKTGDGSNASKTSLGSTAKYSRFHFKTNTDLDVGDVMTYFELDFNGGDGSDVTNQSSSGLRHAFVSWNYSDTGNIKVGQTWGTFFNVGALPETIDFVGPTAGTLFVRQNQLRWTSKLGDGASIMFAAEEPASKVTISGSDYTDDNGGSMPDLVARYNGKSGGLSYSAAAIMRDVSVGDAGNTSNSSKTGMGVSLSGKYGFDNGDALKFMFSHGNLGRYQALGAFNEGWADDDGLKLRDVTGGFVAYQHKWSPTLRSTFLYSTTTGDNEDGYSSPTDTDSISSAAFNLLYSPTKHMTFGAEYMVGERELLNGEGGDEDRLMVTSKFAF